MQPASKSEAAHANYANPIVDVFQGGSHDMIGSCDVTVNSLMTAHSRGAPLELVNPKKRSGRRGMLNIESIKIEWDKIVIDYFPNEKY